MEQPTHQTPAQQRITRQLEVKRALRQAWGDASQSVVAAVAGMKQQRISAMLADDSTKHLTVADALAFPAAVRHALAQKLVGEGWLIIEAPAAAEDLEGDLRLTARAHAETSHAVTMTLGALADGYVSGAEGATLGKQARKAASVMMAIALLGEKAAREIGGRTLRMVSR